MSLEVVSSDVLVSSSEDAVADDVMSEVVEESSCSESVPSLEPVAEPDVVVATALVDDEPWLVVGEDVEELVVIVLEFAEEAAALLVVVALEPVVDDVV